MGRGPGLARRTSAPAGMNGAIRRLASAQCE
jgi:hypothetical protein